MVQSIIMISKGGGKLNGMGITWRGHFVPVCLGVIEQYHKGGHPQIFWFPLNSKSKGLLEFLDLDLVKVFLRNVINLNMCGKMSLWINSA